MAIKPRNPKLQTFGREKNVNIQIIADSVEAAIDAAYSHIPSEFVILVGDSDIQPSVAKIITHGFRVHIWSWENCIVGDHSWQANQLVHFHLLDPYLEQISFYDKI